MESVTTIILDMLSKFVVWLMPHLIAKSSASVLVMWTAWWIVFVKGLLFMCICEIDVLTLFLILISDTIMAVEEDEEDSKTMSSSWWAWDLLSFPLLQILKEIWSEKLSITLSLGENSEWRGIKDRKHSLNLLAMLTKWPLMSECYQLVRESRGTKLWVRGVLYCESMREHTRWLGGNLWACNCDLLPSFWR